MCSEASSGPPGRSDAGQGPVVEPFPGPAPEPSVPASCMSLEVSGNAPSQQRGGGSGFQASEDMLEGFRRGVALCEEVVRCGLPGSREQSLLSELAAISRDSHGQATDVFLLSGLLRRADLQVNPQTGTGSSGKLAPASNDRGYMRQSTHPLPVREAPPELTGEGGGADDPCERSNIAHIITSEDIAQPRSPAEVVQELRTELGHRDREIASLRADLAVALRQIRRLARDSASAHAPPPPPMQPPPQVHDERAPSARAAHALATTTASAAADTVVAEMAAMEGLAPPIAVNLGQGGPDMEGFVDQPVAAYPCSTVSHGHSMGAPDGGGVLPAPSSGVPRGGHQAVNPHMSGLPWSNQSGAHGLPPPTERTMASNLISQFNGKVLEAAQMASLSCHAAANRKGSSTTRTGASSVPPGGGSCQAEVFLPHTAREREHHHTRGAFIRAQGGKVYWLNHEDPLDLQRLPDSAASLSATAPPSAVFAAQVALSSESLAATLGPTGAEKVLSEAQAVLASQGMEVASPSQEEPLLPETPDPSRSLAQRALRPECWPKSWSSGGGSSHGAVGSASQGAVGGHATVPTAPMVGGSGGYAVGPACHATMPAPGLVGCGSELELPPPHGPHLPHGPPAPHGPHAAPPPAHAAAHSHGPPSAHAAPPASHHHPAHSNGPPPQGPPPQPMAGPTISSCASGATLGGYWQPLPSDDQALGLTATSSTLDCGSITHRSAHRAPSSGPPLVITVDSLVQTDPGVFSAPAPSPMLTGPPPPLGAAAAVAVAQAAAAAVQPPPPLVPSAASRWSPSAQAHASSAPNSVTIATAAPPPLAAPSHTPMVPPAWGSPVVRQQSIGRQSTGRQQRCLSGVGQLHQRQASTPAAPQAAPSCCGSRSTTPHQGRHPQGMSWLMPLHATPVSQVARRNLSEPRLCGTGVGGGVGGGSSAPGSASGSAARLPSRVVPPGHPGLPGHAATVAAPPGPPSAPSSAGRSCGSMTHRTVERSLSPTAWSPAKTQPLSARPRAESRGGALERVASVTRQKSKLMQPSALAPWYTR